MRRVNVLPPEDRRSRRPGLPVPSRPGIIGLLLISGALLTMLMIGLYLLYYVRMGNEEDQIAQLDGEVARQQARVRELTPYQNLQARLNAKKTVADGIYRTRFAWDEFLRGLAFVIPDSTTLDNFTGQATPVSTRAQPGRSSGTQTLDPPGSITFTGVALPDYQNVSDFIVRMDNLRFLANAQLSSAQLDRQRFSRPAVTFKVSAELVTRIGEFGNEVQIEDGNQNNSGGGSTARDQQTSSSSSPGVG